ncbi:hypothetical protein ABE66_06755 [Cytobacillus firmus]|nr:hypothetical protein [Cytobacillus firmus]
MSIARPNASAFGRKWVTKTLPQDKESYGSDTSHDRKRQLLGGCGVLSLCPSFGPLHYKARRLAQGLILEPLGAAARLGSLTPTYPPLIRLSLKVWSYCPLDCDKLF